MDLPTWKALAAKLGVSYQGLHLWRKLEDAPPTPDLEAWETFKAERGLGRERATSELTKLKAELLREQIKRERGRNARESGEVIDREVVEAMLATLGQKLNALLTLKLTVELGPRAIGMNAAEMNVEGGAILSEIREVVNANLALYQPTTAAQP